jgi:hypothetical protein
MASTLTWEEAISKWPRRPFTWLRLESDRTYTLRFFHHPIRCRCDSGKTQVVSQSPPANPIVVEGREVRYVQVVLDRGDGGDVKVLEFGEKLFLQIAQRCGQSGVNPGHVDGPDIRIEVTGKGIGREYRVNLGEEVKPVSDEELARLRTALENGLASLLSKI